MLSEDWMQKAMDEELGLCIRRDRANWRSKLLATSPAIQLLITFLAGIAFTCILFGLTSQESPVEVGLFKRRLTEQYGSTDSSPSLTEINVPLKQHCSSKPHAGLERLIVVARHDEDTTWLDFYLSEIPHVIYEVDDPDKTSYIQHRVMANKGNEAMAYLQFIIDYYNTLPSSVVFIHGHSSSWHMRNVVAVVKRLRWGELGFAPLRYKNTAQERLEWDCEGHTDHPFWKTFKCEWVGPHLRPAHFATNAAQPDEADVDRQQRIDTMDLIEAWPQMFKGELGEIPSELQAPCCAMFMVTRERIRAHPKSFYVGIREWILQTEMDSFQAGRMLESTWHIVFGEAPMMEPLAKCRLVHCDRNHQLPKQPSLEETVSS